MISNFKCTTFGLLQLSIKMTALKTCILFLFFLLGTNSSNCQTFNFKTTGLSVMQKDPNGKWGQWTDLNSVSVLVKLDTNKNRIIVYSEILQVFEIVEYIPLEESETDSAYTFICKDNNGKNCTLSIITRKKQDNRKQLYIQYDERIILYNIHNYK
jgi:hypothetical protein